MSSTAYKPKEHRLPSHWDTVVIGSGIGGMACAAALAKFGHRVLVLEQHTVAGGFTHVFKHKGFKFDVGVHCLGQMSDRESPGRIVKWLSDGKIKMNPMGSVYETFHFPGGEIFEFPDKREAFIKTLKQRFPTEERAIDHYFELVREVTQDARWIMTLKILPQWLDSLARLINPKPYRLWSRTTSEVLSELTQNEKLKSILCAQWGYYGATPSQSSFGIHAMVVRHYWNGGYYPEGGSEVFAEHFLNTVTSAGGAVLTRASVSKILFEGGRATGVRMESGEEFYAKKVVSAAGARTTVDRLLPEDQAKSSWAQSIKELQQSPPHLCLYLGLEGDLKAAGGTLSNHWFMDTWDMEVPGWDLHHANSEAPILYVSFPSLKSPGPPPEAGKPERHTVEVVTFVPWEAFKKWEHTRLGKRSSDYVDFKQDLENRILKQMKKKMPKLMDLVVHHELSTPLSTTFFTRAPEGAIYGLEATPRRFTHPGLRARTPLKNLFLAGGDVVTLGVTGALMGGLLAAAAIDLRVLKKLK